MNGQQNIKQDSKKIKIVNRINFKYNPRSKSTILRNVRCFKLWHRRSIATITHWNKQNESYISKTSFIYTSCTTILYSYESVHSYYTHYEFSQILINHFMQCVMLQILTSVQHFCNPTMEPIK